jgi:L-seryl-tRNA(Ser) seleniumtransferase
MVEVGTTNKTRIEDFSAALSEHTRVLLSVHASNFKIVGFTAKPELRELANLAHRNELVCMQDLGSGSLVDLPALGSMAERTVPQSIADGVDLITFSGDKLLGGPQAGIILGRREMIDAIKTNPLLRALRIDKLSLAALEATLRLYLPPNDPLRQIPILRMLSEPPSSVARRARSVVRKLRAVPRITVTLADDVSYGGGGSLPMNAIPTKVIQVRVPGMTAAALAGRLRMGETPVIGRIADELLLLDLRTVPAQDEKAVVSALQQAAR